MVKTEQYARKLTDSTLELLAKPPMSHARPRLPALRLHSSLVWGCLFFSFRCFVVWGTSVGVDDGVTRGTKVL